MAIVVIDIAVVQKLSFISSKARSMASSMRLFWAFVVSERRTLVVLRGLAFLVERQC